MLEMWLLTVVPTLLADVSIAGGETGLRLTFPVQYRADGRQIAAALMTPASYCGKAAGPPWAAWLAHATSTASG